MDAIKKWNNRLEKIWFVIAIIASFFAIAISIIDNFENVQVYYLLALLAWGIYLVRRGLRKRLSKND
jgi:ABC-type nitrate/sulfonate/bicarbonate transport system permease component|tara:strand:- start:645 stop:845 length:201 start_codon:yes stop_codon:yes gene_type:complete